MIRLDTTNDIDVYQFLRTFFLNGVFAFDWNRFDLLIYADAILP